MSLWKICLLLKWNSLCAFNSTNSTNFFNIIEVINVSDASNKIKDSWHLYHELALTCKIGVYYTEHAWQWLTIYTHSFNYIRSKKNKVEYGRTMATNNTNNKWILFTGVRGCLYRSSEQNLWILNNVAFWNVEKNITHSFNIHLTILINSRTNKKHIHYHIWHTIHRKHDVNATKFELHH